MSESKSAKKPEPKKPVVEDDDVEPEEVEESEEVEVEDKDYATLSAEERQVAFYLQNQRTVSE